MAERIEETLEAMVPCLKDLQERGIFSEAEVKKIVKKRRDTEYALRASSARMPSRTALRARC